MQRKEKKKKDHWNKKKVKIICKIEKFVSLIYNNTKQ